MAYRRRHNKYKSKRERYERHIHVIRSILIALAVALAVYATMFWDDVVFWYKSWFVW